MSENKYLTIEDFMNTQVMDERLIFVSKKIFNKELDTTYSTKEWLKKFKEKGIELK
jgi:hypothetical protein